MAAALGLLGTLLRQPLIVSFLAVGLLAGPSVLDIVRSGDEIALLSELGIALLLFLVGIKLDISLIRSLGRVSVMTGLGQVIFTSAIGFVLGLALGLDAITSLYVAVALTFSSTIIIVKLLSDKREIDSLHGQIALGFLIVQDLVVVVAMIVLSAMGIGSADDRGPGRVLAALFSGIALGALVLVLVRYVATPLTTQLARAPELLVTFAIGLAAMFAAVADFAGLGKELGGLLAGVSLASTPYREAIVARLAPLRDFLLLFFFISLGSRLDLSLLGSDVDAAVWLSLFVLIGNPLIVLAIMSAMGFHRRTGFLAGLTVAQISEFSLVFVAMGVTLGHVDGTALGLVTLVGLITIAASTYMITYSHQLYEWCERALRAFDRLGAGTRSEESTLEIDRRHSVIVLGLGRFGTSIAMRLARLDVPVVGVDFNPAAMRRGRRLGLPVVYGDATDPEFVSSLPIAQAPWVVCTIPSYAVGLSHQDPRSSMLHAIRAAGYAGRIAVTAHTARDAELMQRSGADLVLLPFEDAADRAVELLTGTERVERASVATLEGDETVLP